MVPDVYLSEFANHLLDAGSYIQAIGKAPLEQFRYSENAFVSYFASLEHPSLTYRAFLEAFGFRLDGADARRRSEAIEVRLRTTLRRYAIEVAPCGTATAPPEMQTGAEIDLAHVYHDIGANRAELLMKHDAAVLAYLRQKSIEDSQAHFLVTWDKSFRTVCNADEYPWWCMDPASASDLLSLVRPGDVTNIAVEVALCLEPRGQQAAAKIWDVVMKIEQAKMLDAQLVEMAQAFHAHYMAHSDSELGNEAIVTAWGIWKGRIASDSNRGGSTSGG